MGDKPRAAEEATLRKAEAEGTWSSVIPGYSLAQSFLLDGLTEMRWMCVGIWG